MSVSFSICDCCKKKACLKTKKPCQKVERIFRRHKIYSADWIRPQVSKKMRKDGLGKWREVPFSMLEGKKNDFSKSSIFKEL